MGDAIVRTRCGRWFVIGEEAVFQLAGNIFAKVPRDARLQGILVMPNPDWQTGCDCDVYGRRKDRAADRVGYTYRRRRRLDGDFHHRRCFKNAGCCCYSRALHPRYDARTGDMFQGVLI